MRRLLRRLAVWRRRRWAKRNPGDALLELTGALPPPDELPQAPDLTKADERRLRGRQHPIARKRRTGRWG